MTAHTSLWITAVFLILTGCSSLRQSQQEPPPEWVNSRPLSSTHYVGIGSALPQAIPGEALRMAKERAAADLAGEIAVRVESTSLLESEDKNGHVREEFNSTISSQADERIAGFEVMGVYESEQGTHVYYRLNKARHAAAREARRQEAVSLAVEEWKAGQSDVHAGRVPSALEHWATGILALEEFWNEVNRAEIDGNDVALESHLIRAMREVLRDVQLQPAVENVVLSARGGFQFPLGLHCTLRGQSASGVPIHYAYHNGTYRKRGTEFTDEEGVVVALIERVESPRPDRNIVCQVNVERLMDAAHLPSIVAELIGEVVAPEIRVGLEVDMPSFSLVPAADSEVEALLHRPLLDTMRGLLLDAGCVVNDEDEPSDYRIEFHLRDERRTPTPGLGQFHTAYVEGTMALRNASGQLIGEVRLDRVKGVQLDSESALQLALANAAETVEKKHGPALLNVLY